MVWIYVICTVLIGIKMLAFPNLPLATDSVEMVEMIVQETAIPNAVSGIILRNRLYDTIFEVVVFTLATMGVGFLLSNEIAPRRLVQLEDESSILLARLGATLSALVAVELAIRGHLSPGGGFAAGVAGGTAIGLIAITSDVQNMQKIYQQWRVAILEKLAVLLFVGLAALSLLGIELPSGQFGTLLSGGWIPSLNILVAIKVAIGSWAIILAFIRARGLF